MVSIFEYSSFRTLLVGVKKAYRQKDLAKSLNVSVQTVNAVLTESHHLVYPHVAKWRQILGLSRTEGDYFELLSLVQAYSHHPPDRQNRMLKRAFHLAGRLEMALNAENTIPNSLIFWLDPVVGYVRDMTELADFPANEADIPTYVEERLAWVGSLSRVRKIRLERFQAAWRWLTRLKAVLFDSQRQRWIKAEANLLQLPSSDPLQEDMARGILRLSHTSTYQDFSHVLNTEHLLGSKQVTFTVPESALPFLNELGADFIFNQIMKQFTYLVNREDRHRLKHSDPDYLKQIEAMEQELIKKGFDIPHCTDSDMNTTVQMVLGTRKITRTPKKG